MAEQVEKRIWERVFKWAKSLAGITVLATVVIALLATFDRGGYVLVNTVVTGGMTPDQQTRLLRLAARYAQLLREPERRHAVHEAEVDGLGRAALIPGHRLGGYPEDLGCRSTVYVSLLGKCLQQARVR